MVTKYNANFIRWALDSCSSDKIYKNDDQYTQSCCLEQGKHILSCDNIHEPKGWYENYIEFQDHRYCNDFFGFNALREVLIQGIIMFLRKVEQEMKIIILLNNLV